jgi:tetratricopeptide (TPR) repeat protein
MPILYFSLNNTQSLSIAQAIAQEFRISLQAHCVGLDNLNSYSEKFIKENITSSDALIVVVTGTDSKTGPPSTTFNERSCFEIITAMNLDIQILTLLIHNLELPNQDRIPGSLKQLINANSYSVRSDLLQKDLEAPLEDLEEELNFKRDVEEKMFQTMDKSYERLSNSLEPSGLFDLRRVVESELIFLKKARAISDLKAEKNALSALGMAYTRLGQTLKAIDYLVQELTIVRKIGTDEELCCLLASLGDACAIAGDFFQAQKYFEEQKALATEKNYTHYIGSSFNGLGFIYVKQNKIQKAIECYLKALKSCRQQEDHDKELELLVGIGLNYKKMEEWEQATNYLNSALGKSAFVENRKEEAHILIDLAECYHKLGKTEQLRPVLKCAKETLSARNTAWAYHLIQRMSILISASELH